MMQCSHCSRKFSDQSELIAHYELHAAIQDRVSPGRVYGARYESNAKAPDLERNTVKKSANVAIEMERRTTDTTNQTLRNIGHFMNQEEGLLVFRRFSELNVQNLIHRQTELVELERQLRQKDNRADSVPWNDPRREQQLMDSLSEKLDKYNKALLIQSYLHKLNRPEAGFLRILCDWAADSGIQDQHECAFLTDQSDIREDLLTLDSRAERKTWAYRMVEALIWKLLAKKKRTGKISEFDHGGVLYTYNDESIAAVVRMILTIITAAFLVIPIIILYFFRSGANALIVVTTCTVGVAVLISVFTDCRNHEILMAAAAYGAVMMVYMQH